MHLLFISFILLQITWVLAFWASLTKSRVLLWQKNYKHWKNILRDQLLNVNYPSAKSKPRYSLNNKKNFSQNSQQKSQKKDSPTKNFLQLLNEKNPWSKRDIIKLLKKFLIKIIRALYERICDESKN